MRNAAIPALTRGWFSAPANSRLIDAARTRPPAVSAVIRTRVSPAGGRTFFRAIRLGASARPRILADVGVAGFSLSGDFAPNFIGGARPAPAAGFRLGRPRPGPPWARPRSRAGGGSHLFVRPGGA